MSILERTLQFERNPEGFYKQWQASERDLAEHITQARQILPEVTYSQSDLFTIAELMAEMKVDGHRGDIVILKAALAHAALNERRQVTGEDMLVAAELALPHRLKRQPFQDTELQFQELAERLDQIREEADEQTAGQMSQSNAPSLPQEKKTMAAR